jgi:hypothetical protein
MFCQVQRSCHDRAKLPVTALDGVVACVPASAPKGRVTPDFRAKLSWGGRFRCPAYPRSPASAKACVQEKVWGARCVVCFAVPRRPPSPTSVCSPADDLGSVPVPGPSWAAVIQSNDRLGIARERLMEPGWLGPDRIWREGAKK